MPEELIKIGGYFPIELSDWIRDQASKTGESLSDVLIEAVRKARRSAILKELRESKKLATKSNKK